MKNNKNKKGNPTKEGSKKGPTNKNKDGFKPKPKFLTFTPLDHRNQFAQATYKTVKDALLTKIIKTFDKGGKDVKECLENETMITLVAPKLNKSTSTDKDTRALEDQQFQLHFRDEFKLYGDRKEQLETNLTKAYGLIWEDYMAPAMVQKIDRNPDFESTIKDNPIELLKAIKVSMYETVRAQKPIITAVSALVNLVTYKQKDDVTLDKYLRTFKELCDVFKTPWGKHITDFVVEQLP